MELDVHLNYYSSQWAGVFSSDCVLTPLSFDITAMPLFNSYISYINDNISVVLFGI